MKLRLVWMGAVSVLIAADALAGRVPTKYNERYQALYAEQELFRKRPELLGCVNNAKDAVQASSNSLFNKVRFTAKSVQTAYVVDGIQQGIGRCPHAEQVRGRSRVFLFGRGPNVHATSSSAWLPSSRRASSPVRPQPQPWPASS